MKERGIIFGAPMVRALLAGTKTQTRRVAKVSPSVTGAPSRADRDDANCGTGFHFVRPDGHCEWHVDCPYGAPGDRLYVKESHRFETFTGEHFYNDMNGDSCSNVEWFTAKDPGDVVWYDADGEPPPNLEGWTPKRSPLYLPRWASRITLEITDVRVQRLQAITEEDARAEGVTPFPNDPEGDCWTDGKHRSAFEYIWGEINGWDGQPGARAPWPTNPWLWCLTFRRITP